MPSYNKGQMYEMKVRGLLQKKVTIPEDLQGNDAGFIHQDVAHYLEIKNKDAPDYGQKRLVWDEDTRWRWSKNDIISDMFDDFGVINLIDDDFVPRRYSLLKDDITKDDRRFDQQRFEMSGIVLNDINFLYEYYARKNCYYIQIEGKGFYFLKQDKAKLNVPQFDPPLYLRLRAKVHSDKPTYNYSFFAVLQAKRKDISKSNYDIEELVGDFPPIIN